MRTTNNVLQEIWGYLKSNGQPKWLWEIYRFMDASTYDEQHLVRGSLSSLKKSEKAINVKRAVWQSK